MILRNTGPARAARRQAALCDAVDVEVLALECWIPYGSTAQRLLLPDGMWAELLLSSAGGEVPAMEGAALVAAALASPIASPPLHRLANGRKSAVILCSDHTRPVPSKAILPPMLAELRRGSPDMDITLLIATGCHRGTTEAELREKLGDELYEREKVVVHDCEDEAMMRHMGTLPSGAPLIINRLAAETELLLAEGFIEPHFFAGFSGGRKSVLPGVCGRGTVLGNHCAAFIESPAARTGVLRGNPIHTDMAAAARMVGLRFIVNVIINAEKQPVAAFAGDAEKAHEAGCARLDGACRVTAEERADIVVTGNGGYPLDQNIYQSVKSMTAAEAVAAERAVLVVAAACGDGVGGDDFYRALRDCAGPEELLRAVQGVPMEQTAPDQWQYQILARVLSKPRVILVCDEEARRHAARMKLETAESVQQAFERALEEKGAGASVAVIPDGVSVIASVKE